MEEFVITKMIESTFDDEEAMMSYKDLDYVILGDEKAFLVYYPITDKVVWVHFMWASNPRQMYSVLKKFEKEWNPTENLILFDCDKCDGFNALHKHHAKRIYVWTKELK